jgi:hypothetical protein
MMIPCLKNVRSPNTSSIILVFFQILGRKSSSLPENSEIPPRLKIKEEQGEEEELGANPSHTLPVT